MTYTGKCPHCKTVIRGGHGSPWKRIDTPIRTCPHCFHTYMDDNMYEWSVISPIYKLWFYFFANNRFIPWFILACAAYLSWLYLLIGGVAWMIFCVLWVNITKKEQIAESKRRTAHNPEYIKALSASRYDKLAMKYDSFYEEN